MFARLLSLLIATAAVASHAAAPSQWEWIQPQPHRQNWIDLAVGPNGFVGITEGYGGRAIFHSTTGDQWEAANTPSIRPWSLERVKYVNGNYIAVGGSGATVISKDGLDWQNAGLDALESFLDITYGNGVYVVVGYNSIARYSKDLKTWSPLDFPKGDSLVNVEFGNGIFLALATSGYVYRSVDGRLWTPLPWPAGFYIDRNWLESGMAFNNGVFVLSGHNGTVTTADGVVWKNGPTTFYRRIVAAGDEFLASSGNSLAVSSDGITWRTILTAANNSGVLLGALGRLDNKWLAGGSRGSLYGSNGGNVWNAVVKPVDYSHSKIAQGNGTFIRYGEKPGHWLSSDGATWAWNDIGPALTTLSAGNGMWVGVTDEHKGAFSTDGLYWDTVTLPAQPYGDILFANGSFLSAAEGGVLISTDGKNWELVRIANVSSIRLIGFQNGIFAAVSAAWEPVTSTDGRNWTVHSPRPDLNGNVADQFFTAGNGRFIGIGGGGMGPGAVKVSTNGVDWTRQDLTVGSGASYTGLAFGGGYFVSLDSAGSIYSSANGIDWIGGPQSAQPFTDAAYGNGAWVVVGGDSILRSTGAVAAKSVVTLQLTQTDRSNWSLMVTGSPGERWQIQSSAGLNATWEPFQAVEIPAAGKLLVPLEPSLNAAFFRAFAP